MRNALVLLPALAAAAPDLFAAFEPPALLELSPAVNNETLPEDGTLELLRRQNNACATNYAVCTNINQPGLCCPTDSVCSPDSNGNPACCTSGSACTGTISPIGTTSISISTGSGLPSTSASSTTGFVIASPTASATTSGGPFIQQTSAANSMRSTVPNQYYPFPYIATTYVNAAACSSGYTSCQSDAASCTAALASGQQGVTVSAPNGGRTVTAIASLGPASASSICQSLSSQACSGLVVEACARFGPGQAAAAATRCAHVYRVAGGVAVGVAGQLLR